MNYLPTLTTTGLMLGLLTWGSHALVPWSSDPLTACWRRRWQLLAMPLAALALLASVSRYYLWPDPVFGAGLFPPSASRTVLFAVLFGAVMLLADGLLLAAGEKLEILGWRLIGGLGGLALLASSGFEQLLAIGAGPAMRPSTFALALLCRSAFALGSAGLLALGRESSHRSWTWLAAASTLVYWWCLPTLLRQSLGPASILELGGAGLLWLIAHRLPPRLHTAALLGALLLIGLFLADCAALSQHLGETGRS